MDIAELLTRDAIAIRTGASSKREVLHAAADLAARGTGVPSAVLLEGLLTREGLGSTGLGGAVAVPHARIPGLERLVGVFLRLETPVTFEAIDDRPVDIIFALFAPPEAGVEHLRALAAVSRSLRSSDVRQQIRQAASADAIHALLVRSAVADAA